MFFHINVLDQSKEFAHTCIFVVSFFFVCSIDPAAKNRLYLVKISVSFVCVCVFSWILIFQHHHNRSHLYVFFFVVYFCCNGFLVVVVVVTFYVHLTLFFLELMLIFPYFVFNSRIIMRTEPQRKSSRNIALNFSVLYCKALTKFNRSLTRYGCIWLFPSFIFNRTVSCLFIFL